MIQQECPLDNLSVLIHIHNGPKPSLGGRIEEKEKEKYVERQVGGEKTENEREIQFIQLCNPNEESERKEKIREKWDEEKEK